ncbi:unnamed protein product [Clavelina lepadiformis]|uniref:Sulfatase N-terminal domain-containing protein n=1 Tax=Clavelina lepadiformis TaxID=159417 RepID=A0ABP0FUU4_CLALP
MDYHFDKGFFVTLSWIAILQVLLINVINGQPAGSSRRPNIVIFMSDDQDIMLGSMDVMHFTRDRMISPGVTFANAFTTSPICCPSRSSFLTGLYSHNHNVLTNNDNCSSPLWQRTHETRTFAAYLNDSGYSTGYFGKYLNEYNGSYIPPGWQYWMGLLKNSKYYNYSLNHNGRKEIHKDNYEKDYLTDLVVNRSVQHFRQSKEDNPTKPILTMLSFPAPHGPEDGAPQYQHLYANVTSHITPSYDYVTSNQYKHWILSKVDQPLDKTQHRFSMMLQQKRLQTLRSVDNAIEKFISMLEEIGELDNTYIIYTSDHGFHIGQFGLAKGKSMPYDFDIRIPFYLRGPGIPSNTHLNHIILNIDVAPTILGMAGVEIPESMDGRNFMPLINSRQSLSPPWRDTFLIERGKIPLTKIHLEKPRLPSKREKVIEACQKKEFKFPCEPRQTWTCALDEGVLKMRKCNKFPKVTSKPAKRKNCCPKKGKERISPKCKQRLYQATRGKRRFFRRSTDSRRTYSYEEFVSNMLEMSVSDRAQQRKRRSRVVNNRNTGQRKGGANGTTKNWKVHLTSDCKVVMPVGSIKCNKDRKVSKQDYWRKSIKAERTKLRLMRIVKTCMKTQKKRPEKCNCPTKPSRPRRSVRSRPDRPTPADSENNIHPMKQIYDQIRAAHRQRVSDFRDEVRRKKELQKIAQAAKREKIARRIQNQNGTNGGCFQQRVNCFKLSRSKWMTPPIWEGDDRCYCTNSNNNTYWCVRIINETSNLLYCEFITGFIEYYDLTTDPYQLSNALAFADKSVLSALNSELARLRVCNGSADCHIHRPSSDLTSTITTASTTTPRTSTTTLPVSDVAGPVGSINLDSIEPAMETSTMSSPTFDLPTNYPPGTIFNQFSQRQRRRKNQRRQNADNGRPKQRGKSEGGRKTLCKRRMFRRFPLVCPPRNPRQRSRVPY